MSFVKITTTTKFKPETDITKYYDEIKKCYIYEFCEIDGVKTQ